VLPVYLDHYEQEKYHGTSKYDHTYPKHDIA
jgi:hypothetical protein